MTFIAIENRNMQINIFAYFSIKTYGPGLTCEKKVHSNMRETQIQITLRMRKISSGPFALHSYIIL